MSIYEERPDKVIPNKQVMQDDEFEINPYIDLTDVLNSYVDFYDSVIYFNDDIGERTIVDLMIRFRSLLKYRDSEDYTGNIEKPINLVLNSPGGEIHEMMGLIDYIDSLKQPVNIIIRGKAFSAAAVVLASTTGQRMMSVNSTIMFHQPRSMMEGKLTDVVATIDYVNKIEQSVYNILAARSNKEASWWKDNMRSDLYLSAEEAKELGVIDIII
jgi:ATP-dependent Clp endopeptidase proteolytic subunit ClpP